jgi:hypothetical protein
MLNPGNVTGSKGQSWLDRLAENRPDVALMAPMLVYLALLLLRDSALLPY